MQTSKTALVAHHSAELARRQASTAQSMASAQAVAAAELSAALNVGDQAAVAKASFRYVAADNAVGQPRGGA